MEAVSQRVLGGGPKPVLGSCLMLLAVGVACVSLPLIAHWPR